MSERKGDVWASNKRDEREMTESKVGEIETRQRRESARPTRRDGRELRVEGVDDSMAGPEWRQQVEGDECQPVDNWASPGWLEALPSTLFGVRRWATWTRHQSSGRGPDRNQGLRCTHGLAKLASGPLNYIYILYKYNADLD